ncbi:MAG TPA: tripartite tricarboxylate transporter substrate binding protein [Burkholderiales bacterium]|nr:tripartite tricarboxylate transporter substrate binding protein [Burkholderiales bacterium]
MNDSRFFILGLAVLGAAAAGAASAAEWTPSKPVRFIVGFPPGGATDLIARMMQPKMAAGLGRQVIVENRAGANGVIGTEAIARADPDGHTIGMVHIGSLVISPVIQKVPYDVHKDLVPLGQIVSLQNIVLVHPTLPAKTTKDYLALARGKPGLMLYGTSGTGSPGHLAGVLLESMTGVKLTHVPYKGGGPLITDLIAGHIQSSLSVISTGLPHVRSGKVRAVAVTGAKRAEAAPEIPTVGETVKGYAAVNWYGMMAPAGTPAPVVDRLHREIVAAVQAPDVVKALKDRGIEAAPSTPAEFARFIQAEQKKWTPIIKKSNIKEE